MGSKQTKPLGKSLVLHIQVMNKTSVIYFLIPLRRQLGERRPSYRYINGWTWIYVTEQTQRDVRAPACDRTPGSQRCRASPPLLIPSADSTEWQPHGTDIQSCLLSVRHVLPLGIQTLVVTWNYTTSLPLVTADFWKVWKGGHSCSNRELVKPSRRLIKGATQEKYRSPLSKNSTEFQERQEATLVISLKHCNESQHLPVCIRSTSLSLWFLVVSCVLESLAAAWNISLWLLWLTCL